MAQGLFLASDEIRTVGDKINKAKTFRKARQPPKHSHFKKENINDFGSQICYWPC